MDADERRKQLSAALNRVASADRAALRLVYDMTAAKLFGLCLRILNDRSEAEDVLQDVYMTVWQKAATFNANRASPITWLVAIARNRAIDRARSRGPRRLNEPIDAADKSPILRRSLPNGWRPRRSMSGLSPVWMRSNSGNPWPLLEAAYLFRLLAVQQDDVKRRGIILERLLLERDRLSELLAEGNS